MARRPLTNPRKQASQERSRATVDALVEATARILVREGFDKASTNRIAEAAGVSIGSLYQYFPNKEALITALIERHAGEIMAIMHRALDDPASRTLADGLKAMIEAGAAAHRLDPALHKILHEQVPRVGRLAKAMDTSRQIAETLERFLRLHADELHPDRDPATAAIVIETAIEALAHKAVVERQDLLADGLLEREAFSLAASYLLRSAIR
jgi:AcrR family transcriptional regulator